MTKININSKTTVTDEITYISSVDFDYLGEKIYSADRYERMYGIFVSDPIVSSSGILRWNQLTWNATKDDDSEIFMFIKSSDSEDGLQLTSWSNLLIDSPSDISAFKGQYLQIMVVLRCDNNNLSVPIVNRINASYFSSETSVKFFSKAFEIGFKPEHVLLTYNSDETDESVIRFAISGEDSADISKYQYIDPNKIEKLSGISRDSEHIKVMIEMLGSSETQVSVHEFALMFSGDDAYRLNKVEMRSSSSSQSSDSSSSESSSSSSIDSSSSSEGYSSSSSSIDSSSSSSIDSSSSSSLCSCEMFDAEADLVNKWILNESPTTTTAVDSVGSDNGTLTSMAGTEWTGSSLVFGGLGSGDNIDMGTGVGDFGSNGSYTLAAWVKPYSHKTLILNPESDIRSGFQTIIGNGAELASGTWSSAQPGYWFVLNGSKLLHIMSDNTPSPGRESSQSVDDVPLNVWTHVAVVFDKSDDLCTLYVNGEGQTPADITAITISSSNVTFNVGAKNSGGTDTLDGELADVRTYDVPLGECDVYCLYAEGEPS